MYNKLRILEDRENIIKYVKYKEKPNDSSHLVNYKIEKEYEYYKCDFCGDEIKILKNKYKMTGLILELPKTLTRKRKTKLALCNKCINPAVKLFEEENNAN